MESEFFSILIWKYTETANVDSSFTDSYFFDQECGIDYIGLDPKKENHFMFKITNMQKFFLAKIKYGL